ncbi:MAG: hypothetical protein CSA53_02920 [Gammaproteobacteria bacterium]|nr:MAG: hypothetical protein CSA53_02920 [Gammaproteobacteria bacterium]
MNTTFRTLLLLTAALLCSTANAKAETWYQVELAIFATDNSAALTQEQWPLLPKLQYPSARRFLVYPELVARERAKPGQSVSVDESGRVTIELGQQATRTEKRADKTARAFYVLPEAQRTLNSEVAALTHSGARELLFYQSWVQPVKNKSAAVPIVLDNSGDTDTWPRLQGSITLYLSRYLHLSTNLWLNTYGKYLTHPNWQMPPPPLGPKSIIMREADNYRTPVSGSELRRIKQESGETYAPRYPWRHAITLTQSRRMRAGEVHYLDNPAFGIIAKVMPVEVQDFAPNVKKKRNKASGDAARGE